MNVRSLKQMTVIVGLSLLVSCGNGGGGGRLSLPNNKNNIDLPPYISASLISFHSGSNPGSIPTASVMVQDSSTGIDITTAIVTINDISLTYKPASGHKAYEGDVSVAPGDNVVLSVTVREKTYTASIAQFTSYPTISYPVAGTWYASIPNTVKWSSGTPTPDAVYNIAVLDANNPYGDLVWPTNTNNYFLVLPTSTTSYQIPGNNVSAGDRLFLAGLVKGVSIPGAAYGSELLVAGCSTVPITVVDATLTSIAVTPPNPSIPWGTTQQFTAIGTFSDNSTQDLTGQVQWGAADFAATMDYTIPGLARAQYAGTATISASLAGVTGSTSLTVMPASLLSIEISPSNRTIVRGTIQHFSAAGRYEDGYLRDITSSVTWSSSNTDVATINNGSGHNGEATAVASGTSTISATLSGISGTAALIITDWPSISGNYVYLQSDTGDYIGSGTTYTFTQDNVQITASATGGHLSVTVTGNQDWWFGDFVVPNSLSQLQSGYYGNLTRYPFNDPAVGGLDWFGNGRGCNTLSGWFAIDNVTYNSGNLTAIDLRFEQHCEGWSPALYGWIHWAQ
jgi:hypothetical protein